MGSKLNMRIGVVSDTHMPRRAKQFPEVLVEGLKGVDLILHAGDWTALEVVHEFEKIAPVEGVAGNNDGEEIRKRFGSKKVLTLNGYRIGLVHGDGRKGTTQGRAWEAFRDEKVDLIIFGHSHIPFYRIHKGVVLFNPGSPTDKRKQPKYSYGILTLGKTISAQHYYFSHK